MVVIFFFLLRKNRKLSYLIYLSLFFLITERKHFMKQRYIGYLILAPIVLLSYFIPYFTAFLVVTIVTIYFHHQENTNNFKKEKQSKQQQ